MSANEADYLTKAHRMLAQAQAMNPADAPESVVHLCYYAISAALLGFVATTEAREGKSLD